MPPRNSGKTSLSATIEPDEEGDDAPAGRRDGELADDRVVVGERLDGARTPDALRRLGSAALNDRTGHGRDPLDRMLRQDVAASVVEQHANRRRARCRRTGRCRTAQTKAPRNPPATAPPAAMSSTITLMPAASVAPTSAWRPTLRPTIVSELTGIRIAVASGVSAPGERQRQADGVVDDRDREAER